jgi:hypothetical protein
MPVHCLIQFLRHIAPLGSGERIRAVSLHENESINSPLYFFCSNDSTLIPLINLSTLTFTMVGNL